MKLRMFEHILWMVTIDVIMINLVNSHTLLEKNDLVVAVYGNDNYGNKSSNLSYFIITYYTFQSKHTWDVQDFAVYNNNNLYVLEYLKFHYRHIVKLYV